MNNTNFDPNNNVQPEQPQNQPPYQQPQYQQPQYQQPQYQQPPYQQYQYPQMPMQSTAGKGQSVAALVLGIVSAAFSMFLAVAFPINLIFLVCGIVGIVLGVIGRKKSIEANGKASGLATAGFVLSIIGTVLSGLFIVSCLACVACASTGASSLGSALLYY